jgi:hypothetical protein
MNELLFSNNDLVSEILLVAKNSRPNPEWFFPIELEYLETGTNWQLLKPTSFSLLVAALLGHSLSLLFACDITVTEDEPEKLLHSLLSDLDFQTVETRLSIYDQCFFDLASFDEVKKAIDAEKDSQKRAFMKYYLWRRFNKSFENDENEPIIKIAKILDRKLSDKEALQALEELECAKTCLDVLMLRAKYSKDLGLMKEAAEKRHPAALVRTKEAKKHYFDDDELGDFIKKLRAST